MKADAEIPLLHSDRMQETIIWRADGPVSRADLLTAALRLAERLPERAYVLNACESRHGFILAFLAALLRGQVTLLPNDRSRHVLTSLQARFPDLYCLRDATEPLDGIETLPLVYDPGGDLPREVPRVPANRLAAIAFTSGTTGDPVRNNKPVGLLSTTARLIAKRFGLVGNSPVSIVATVPPQHMYGLETSVALPLWAGVVVHSGRPLYPADIAAALSLLPEPRVLVTTPLHLRAMLEADVTAPNLSAVISATAPLSQTLARQAERRLKSSVYEIFGFSEAGTIATRRTVEGALWRTCDGLKLRQEGEVCLVDAPHFAEAVPFGDLVELVTAETFRLIGRASDQIKIAGKRASLVDLNNRLNSIPGVVDGTFYLSDEKGGDQVVRLVAFVVAPNLGRDEIRTELRRSLDPTFLPRRIYLVPSLPRSATGKLPQAALSELARSLKVAGK